MHPQSKLIIGLGDILQSPQQDTIASNYLQDDLLAAVHIGSSQAYTVPPTAFLGQEHCIDIPRALLKELLPFLAHDASQKTANIAWHHSRRYARFLFAQYQTEIYQTIDHSLDDAAITPENIVVFIDMADAFANSIWLDCLYFLQQRFPSASCFPVFLFPNADTLNPTQAAIVGAAMTELKQVSQGKWQPQDLNTGHHYGADTPLWSIAYLQYFPKLKYNSVYYNLCEDLLYLATSSNTSYGSLQENLEQEYTSILAQQQAPQLLRFANVFSSSLNVDMSALQQLARQHVQHQVWAWLPYSAAQPQFWDTERLYRDNLCLLSKHLHTSLHAYPTAVQWQHIRLSVNTTPASKQSWRTQIAHVQTECQQLYQQAHAEMHAYQAEHINTDTASASSHIHTVVSSLWQHWRQGHVSLHDLHSMVADLIAEGEQQHQRLSTQRQTLQQSLQKCSHDLQKTITSWQQSDGQQRHNIEAKFPIEHMAAELVSAYAHKCDLAFNTCFTALLTDFQQHLQQLQQDLAQLILTCQQQAQALALSTQHQVQDAESTWMQKSTENLNCHFRLQPNQNSLDLFDHRGVNQALLHEMVAEIQASVDVSASTHTLFQQLPQALQQWLPNSPCVQQHATQVWEEKPHLLQLILKNLILELDSATLQQLATDVLDSLHHKNESILTPLGRLLTHKPKNYLNACMVCDETLLDHVAVHTMTQLCTQQNLPIATSIGSKQALGVRFLSAQSCYLEEVTVLQPYIQAYQHLQQHEEAILHLHIDGNHHHIRVLQKNSIRRNRELIRQHLLLAYASGDLVAQADAYCLNLQQKQVCFPQLDLNDVVEHIDLTDMHTLVQQHQQHALDVIQQNPQQIKSNLRDALLQMQQQTLPKGMRIEDADWQTAGRFVVWKRAAQQLQQRWLKHANAA